MTREQFTLLPLAASFRSFSACSGSHIALLPSALETMWANLPSWKQDEWRILDPDGQVRVMLLNIPVEKEISHWQQIYASQDFTRGLAVQGRLFDEEELPLSSAMKPCEYNCQHSYCSERKAERTLSDIV